MRKSSFTSVFVVLVGLLAGFLTFTLLSAVIAPAALAGSACYQHHYLGDYPGNALLSWSTETQGVTHDVDNWYIVENEPFPDVFSCKGMVWRIPITKDLDEDAVCGVDGVSCTGMSDDICDNGYNHAGDAAYYAYGGQGYILVPLEDDDHVKPAVAIYKADSSLDLVGWANLALTGSGQRDASYVAVNKGKLYMSNHDDTFVNRYDVNWERLTNGDGSLVITHAGKLLFRDGNNAPLQLDHWQQGGAFSEDPRLPFPLFYLLNGTQDDYCANYCGINVFEVRDWDPNVNSDAGAECAPEAAPCTIARLVERSTNGSGDFNYEYHPKESSEEPEGITFWDLDADGRAPGISGQFHAILLDNNGLTDNVFIKHYRLETDNVPPTITCPSNATVECTGNNGINANDPQLAPFFAGASATDECDKAPVITNDATSFFLLGSHEVIFTARDYFRNTSSCPASVLVQDTQKPTINVTLDRTMLWPPNHKLVTIRANVTVSDVCDPNPKFVLTSITSNEPDNGLGDGDTANDIQGATYGTPDVEFQLRAERSGKGNGRVYTVVYTAYDGSGNSSQAVATVVVPHN